MIWREGCIDSRDHKLFTITIHRSILTSHTYLQSSHTPHSQSFVPVIQHSETSPTNTDTSPNYTGTTQKRVSPRESASRNLPAIAYAVIFTSEREKDLARWVIAFNKCWAALMHQLLVLTQGWVSWLGLRISPPFKYLELKVLVRGGIPIHRYSRVGIVDFRINLFC